MTVCTHHYCRCMRAAELARLADTTGRVRYLCDAIKAHGQEVVCRLKPTDEPGAIPAKPGVSRVWAYKEETHHD